MRSLQAVRLLLFATVFAALAAPGCQRKENHSPLVEQSTAKKAADGPTNNTLTAEDKNFLLQAAQQNVKLRNAAQIAESRGQSSDVKEYAKVVGSDYDKAEKKLTDLMNKYGEPVSEAAGNEGDADIENLRSIPEKSFDDAFITMIIQTQQNMLTEFQQAASMASNADVRGYADSELPVIQQDLAKARRIRAELQT